MKKLIASLSMAAALTGPAAQAATTKFLVVCAANDTALNEKQIGDCSGNLKTGRFCLNEDFGGGDRNNYTIIAVSIPVMNQNQICLTVTGEH